MKIITTDDTVDILFGDEPLCPICKEYMERNENFVFTFEDIGIELSENDFFATCCGGACQKDGVILTEW